MIKNLLRESDSEDEEKSYDGLYIVVDDRERKITPYIADIDSHIPYKIDRLTSGDYAIMYNGHILAIIERKTWKDMAASIKDGRLKNVNNLLEISKETNCTIFYIIEGIPFPNPKKKVQRICYKNLISHLDHLQIRDNIHIIQTKNKEDTAKRLFTLAENIGTLKIEFFRSCKKGGDENKLKKKRTIKDEEIEFKMWCAIPYITYKTAKLFIDKKYTIKNLILGNISRSEIAMLEYPTGTKIGKRAEKILKITDAKASSKKYINILSEIPLISKNTAQIILEKYNMEELLKLEDINKLKGIKKSSKRSIGEAASKNIINFLIK